MTKSTITREQLEEWVAQFDEDGGCDATDRQLEALIRQSLAAMDSEPVGNEFIPKNLDKALGVVGMALPESKEEFNFQVERWVQRLINLVIRYADEFKEQPAPVVPDFKKLALELVDNLVDCGGLDEGVKEKYLEWAEKTCRAAMLSGGKS